MVAKCSAIARSGNRCASPVLPGSSFCYLHSPEMADRRREAARKGGRNRANAVRAARAMPVALTSDDLLVTLSRAIAKVERGELEPGPANAMASLARVMTAIREASDLERRLAELEQRAGVTDTRWRA